MSLYDRTPSRRPGAPVAPSPSFRDSPTPGAASDLGSTLSDTRRRQNKKDEAIRKKIEADLNKKRNAPARQRHTKRAAPGTVSSLRPTQALTVRANITVSEASQLMAARRADCVLVIDDEEHLTGIFTAKDLAFRVVGDAIDARSVTVAHIMTKNPMCTRIDTSATEALETMVRKGFRHLPVCNEEGDVIGLLDITKCFYEAMDRLERAYASSKKLYDALEGVQSEMGGLQQPQQIIAYVEALRQKMSGPNLASVLDGTPPTMVSVRTSVREAATLMRENHTTAILVMDGDNIQGIFTSKDVVLRVIAAGLDPDKCSVVRVMTPHPDTAPMSLSVQGALRKMNDGHYLNLPVTDNDSGEVVGVVDILKLTYATLEQINTIQANDGEGPMWNRFWNTADDETASVHSDSQINRAPTPLSEIAMHSNSPAAPVLTRLDSVLPGDSASQAPESEAQSTPVPLDDEVPFPFKFKAPSGRVHRFQITPKDGFQDLRTAISEKLGAEKEDIGGDSFAISYVDDEGDIVAITSSSDVLDAVDITRRAKREKVDLYVHDPTKAAVPVAVPQPVLAPVSEEVSTVSTTKAAPEPEAKQAISGVPNELLLPSALVTLAVAIVVVFTLGRGKK
ncbi:CBS-domain-containing protein [Saitoella complicata NRRL Y-17804]|uniref:CBS domain-containing protein n=1 Tax=Saitoella complicata (strain BCRC 22490 / CBS 7301 / JCM 7358 / NBRC 10748 / NRRL Y-17804) TaxID=698492 RepID=A0A0E9N9K9_SAICN|nr:CBS-domain-containing protein [Saitoella complicata NRRL Y-17804]ODQ56548.1 CBS-domain-containing protein [Saitoella complicata NRRL Y-17804]GAO46478.1 hypothetical protein G7K_0709-t1 [Saitoella complicata NRRL Y-17804]